jgi:hypothetical protein
MVLLAGILLPENLLDRACEFAHFNMIDGL